MAKKMETRREPEMVSVDVKKLGHGMKTLFTGMAEVFDSLGVDAPAVGLQQDKPAEEAPAPEKSETAAQGQPDVVDDDPPFDTEEAETPEQAAEEEPEAAASAVTVDDITKVIVSKIKQNRKNNEKIGALLKTYGVAKVSELAPSRYEAFLTDISQI